MKIDNNNDYNIRNVFRFNNNIKYFVSRNECIHFRKSILEHLFISNCDIYHNIIHQSIYMWSTIYTNFFIKLDNNVDYNLIFNISLLDKTTLGLCKNTLQYPNSIIKSEILINKDFCFYSNSATCEIINKMDLLNIDLTTAIIISSIFFFLGLLLIFYDNYIYYKRSQIISKSYFIVYGTLLYIYWYNFRSCFVCYSLMNIIIHEIGHTLGLGHTNTSDKSIMSPIYNRKINNCIYDQDMKLYNKIYNSTFKDEICNNHSNVNLFFISDILILLFLLIFLCFIFPFLINKYICWKKIHLMEKKNTENNNSSILKDDKKPFSIITI